MNYLPINLDVRQQKCLLVGGGSIAYRKVKWLLTAGALVTIVAKKISSQLKELISEVGIDYWEREYLETDLNGVRLVIAATNDHQLNSQVAAQCEANGILVNVVDTKDLCRFVTPSVIDRSPLTIAISSSGCAPVLARMLREKIEWMLPYNMGDVLEEIEKKRSTVASSIPDMKKRRQFWETFFEDYLDWSVAENVSRIPESFETSTIAQWIDGLLANETDSAIKPRLTLIDLGDGEYENLTVAILKKLQKAEVLFMPKCIQEWSSHLIRRDADIHFLNRNTGFDSSKSPSADSADKCLDEGDLSAVEAELAKGKNLSIILPGNYLELEKSKVISRINPKSGFDLEFIRAPH